MFSAKMGVERQIFQCSDDTLIRPVLDMFSSLGTRVPFGKTEVNQIDNFIFFTLTDTHIFGFHISVHKRFSMETLKSDEDLVGHVADGFTGEVFAAEVKQLTKVRP